MFEIALQYARLQARVFVRCRAREAELEKQFQSDLACTEADYLRKTQDMLSEFNRAQQLLKDKITKQQNMYVSQSYKAAVFKLLNISLCWWLSSVTVQILRIPSRENSNKLYINSKKWADLDGFKVSQHKTVTHFCHKCKLYTDSTLYLNKHHILYFSHKLNF